jgi:hypothetical protein
VSLTTSPFISSLSLSIFQELLLSTKLHCLILQRFWNFHDRGFETWVFLSRDII